MQNYIELAQRTKSDKFYANKVPLGDIQMAMHGAIAALRWLDKIKKALFYGCEYHPVSQLRSEDLTHVAASIAEALPTYEGEGGDRQQHAIDILHAILGKATEAGELLEHLNDVCAGKAFDPVNFREEIGDGFWYDAIGLSAVQSTFQAVQHTNIVKLSTRFPEKFTEDKANTRDLDAERKTLEDDARRNAISGPNGMYPLS